MARYDKCFQRLKEIAGRDLTDKEIDAVFTRIHKSALDIKAGRTDIQDVTAGGPHSVLGKAVGESDDANVIIQRAADQAAAEMTAQAEHQERKAHEQVLKIGARLDNYKELGKTVADPLQRAKLMAFRNYKGVNIESMEQHIAGVKAELLRDVLQTWDALGNDFMGFFQDKAKQLDLLQSLLGQKSANADVNKGADIYRATSERGRLWFNEVGGDIGKLENYAFPQHHSQAKAADASFYAGGTRTKDIDANQKAWVDQYLNWLDKSKYVDEYTGRQFTDDEIREFLGKAWETVSTNGINKMEPGKSTGTGIIANRHAEHRSIHFKDAESALAAWAMFGEKSVPEVLYGHLDTMARDIGITEYWGPNDRLTWKTVLDTAMQEAVLADRAREPKITADARRLNTYYEYSTRGGAPSSRPMFSAAMDGIAHLNTAAKGGLFFISSLFGDRAMFEAVSSMNNLPFFQRWGEQMSLLNPTNVAGRRELQRNGLMLDVVQSNLNRFYSDFNTSSAFSSFTGKLANGVMRLTGMRAINEIPKAAFSALTFDAIGREIQAGRKFADIQGSDARLLRNWGITETDWNVWRMVEPHKTSTFEDSAITPEGISQITESQLKAAGLIGPGDGAEQAAKVKRDATVKLLGASISESEFAIVTPGMYERAQFYGQTQRGTGFGELSRMVLQFKSFPWTQLMRVMDVLDNQETYVGKAIVGSALIAGLTLTGAMTLQVKEMLGGKDPRKVWADKDFDKFKFWGAAFLQGGAMGIYGDFLYSFNQTRYGSGPLEIMAGPTLGPMLELAQAPFHAARGAMEGKETHVMAKAAGQLKGFVPGSNIWYAKTALDHLVWQRAMEALSPGYLTTIRQKTQKEYGQDWWWQPGVTAPERAPDLGAAVAQ